MSVAVNPAAMAAVKWQGTPSAISRLAISWSLTTSYTTISPTLMIAVRPMFGKVPIPKEKQESE